MKLLFDQNLSHRLVRLLADIYPDCQHVRNVGLKEAPDTEVWNFARDNGYALFPKTLIFTNAVSHLVFRQRLFG